MIVGIHQLHYLPWLRYIHKILSSDVFIVLDNIQYNKNGHQNRNRIKTPQGAATLTVPVFDRLGQRLDEVAIDNKGPWARKHWRSIAQHYRNAPYFPRYADWLEEVYSQPWVYLNDLNRSLLTGVLLRLEIETPVVYASELKVPGEATERLIQLIHAVKGDTYLSGAHAVDSYLDVEALEASGIALQIQSWNAPTYPQGRGPFLPELSIIDLMMQCGPDARTLLEGVPHDCPQ